MKIYGSFINEVGKEVKVVIQIKDAIAGGGEIEIGTEEAGLWFSGDDPVKIEAEMNDTFDHLLRHSATVRLLSREFRGELFQRNCRDAVVNIWEDGKCVFAGYVEPLAYSQPYNDVLDEVEISCVDALSALQYSKYMDVGSAGVRYRTAKRGSGRKSFAAILEGILGDVSKEIALEGEEEGGWWYDGSRAVDNAEANRYKVFEQIGVTDRLFFGDEEDDMWGKDEVVEEILKYLNLHIEMVGRDFYIFSWESVKEGKGIDWVDIRQRATGDKRAGRRTEGGQRSLASGQASGTDARLNVGEAYNLLKLTAKTEGLDDVVVSPLDNDSLISVYDRKQKYLTEYSSGGEGVRACRAFGKMIAGNATDYSVAKMREWWIRVKRNVYWTMRDAGGDGGDLVERYCKGGLHQEALPNYLGAHTGAMLIALGKVERDTGKKDNSPTGKVDMSDWFVVSVNGNGKDGENDCYPNSESLKRECPVAVYKSGDSDAVYSPVDDDTTNYIVISGRVVLNPLMPTSGKFHDMQRVALKGWAEDGTANPYWLKGVVASSVHHDGRYYAREYWKEKDGSPHEIVSDESDPAGFVPFTEEGEKKYEYKYSAVGDRTDTISKVGVLQCMLRIGDKCVVETLGQGRPDNFVWQKYKTKEECRAEAAKGGLTGAELDTAADDMYYQQSFSIGFDPKIGDMLIGAEFEIQRNAEMDLELGIGDADGMAIPIRRGDGVSGDVEFQVLGPVNVLWDDITRRHPTFFRHTKWGKKSVPLMAHVSSVMVKQMEIKLYSDNGGYEIEGDKDIVYMSDTDEAFVNKKDDIEMKIHSALTSEECKDLGVKQAVYKSTAVRVDTGEAVREVYDYIRGESGKPEQMYVDSYYQEYHLPRVEMEQGVMNRDGKMDRWRLWRVEAIGRTFYTTGMDRDLKEGSVRLKGKEVY